MSTISIEHKFWAKLMSNVIEQAETDSKVKTIVTRLVKSINKQNSDPCRTATRGFRTNTFPIWPLFIDTSILGQKFSAKQAFLKELFVRNPTPTHVEEIPNKDNDHIPEAPVFSNHAMAAQPPLEHDEREFFKLMVKTMQKNAACLPPGPN
jgi:hypothetical protein